MEQILIHSQVFFLYLFSNFILHSFFVIIFEFFTYNGELPLSLCLKKCEIDKKTFHIPTKTVMPKTFRLIPKFIIEIAQYLIKSGANTDLINNEYSKIIKELKKNLNKDYSKQSKNKDSTIQFNQIDSSQSAPESDFDSDIPSSPNIEWGTMDYFIEACMTLNTERAKSLIFQGFDVNQTKNVSLFLFFFIFIFLFIFIYISYLRENSTILFIHLFSL